MESWWFWGAFAKADHTATTAKEQQQKQHTTKRISHSAMLIFHSSFNVVRIYVMHVYCLTEINTLNLTTIYKVFAYVIFHDKIYTHTHWMGFFFACVRSFIHSSSFCMLVFINLFTYHKCEIMYRQQRTFIKKDLQEWRDSSHTANNQLASREPRSRRKHLFKKNNVRTLFLGPETIYLGMLSE